jgi:catechol 2,3-dioxygenase
MSIDPRTTIGAVDLAVSDLERLVGFYEKAVGLRATERGPDAVALGADGAGLVELAARPGASPRPPRTTGLFHLALLVPSRLELARALRRLADAGASLTGASDHLVSEALYLRDPEGNGIEIYRDRPREEWRRIDGELEMATLPLDLRDLVGELEGDEPASAGMPAGTRVGHVHLQVADIAEAEAFYHGLLGFDVTVGTYPDALFLSAGGYHHHLGINTWETRGAPAPPADARGLRWFEVVLPTTAARDELAARVRAAGAPAEDRPDGVLVRDPSGNGVLLTASA